MKYCANDSCPDLQRLGRRGEFIDQVEACPKCGEPLAPGEAPRQVGETQWVDQVRIATFLHAPEAHVACANLVAHGIPAVVLDEYLVGTNWLYSQAVGGVKLCVPREHAEAATAFLARDDSEALRSVPEGALPPSPDELCPKCGAPASGRVTLGRLSRVLSLLLIVPILFWRHTERCSACGHCWRRSRHAAA